MTRAALLASVSLFALLPAAALAAGTAPIVSIGGGGTGATTAAAARANMGAAALGANSDITGLSGLTAMTPPATSNNLVTTNGGQFIVANDNYPTSQPIAATAIVPGNFYKIDVPAATIFTALGSADNNPNTIFQAVGISTTSTAAESSGTALAVATTAIPNGAAVSDLTTPSAIPANTTVLSGGGTNTLTLSAAVTNVGNGDVIVYLVPPTGGGTVWLWNHPFQGFQYNYNVNNRWNTDQAAVGPVSLAQMRFSMNGTGYGGAQYGKGVTGFGISMNLHTGWDSHETTAFVATGTLFEPLTTSTDVVGGSSALLIDNTCETGETYDGEYGCHGYAHFVTVNMDNPLGKVPIWHLLHGEGGVISGAVVGYRNGVHMMVNGSAPESGTLWNASSLSPNAQYTISSNTFGTIWTNLGALDNNIGTTFVYNGVTATGTDQAITFPFSAAFALSAAGPGGLAQAWLCALCFETKIPQKFGAAALPQPLRPEGFMFGLDDQTPCTAAGPILSGAFASGGGGSGYTPASGTQTYLNVPLTGGHGTGGLANITVTNGVVAKVVLVGANSSSLNSGAAYRVGDPLSASAALLGGTGSGFLWNVVTVAPPGPIASTGLLAGGGGYTPLSGAAQLYSNVQVTGGNGTNADANVTVQNGAVVGFIILGVTPGKGFAAGDAISVAAASIGGTGSGFYAMVAETLPSCPMTIANLVKSSNIAFTGPPVNVTNKWIIDPFYKEQIGSVDLYDLSPGSPNGVNDLMLTALTTRNAGAALPPVSIPASDCGNDNDGCWYLKGGLNTASGVGGVAMYVPWYYNPPDGSLTVKGPSKAVGTYNGAFGLSMGSGTVTQPNCGALGFLSGLSKCLSWYVGSTQYGIPVALLSGAVVPQQVLNTEATAPSGGNLSLTGADVTGATGIVGLNLTAALTAGANAILPNVTTLVAAMQADGISPVVNATYELDVYSSSSGNFTWTIAKNPSGSGWTLNGAQTIAQNTMRRYFVSFQSLTAATLTSGGEFAIAGSI